MATLTAADIYDQLREAGYSPGAAVVQAAIALAESGGDDTARGDLALQDSTWGPSFGLFQIRTLKGQTGTGRVRDISWLAAGDDNQARAAYDISRHGTDFSAWTTYTRGTYLRYLDTARAAAVDAGATSGPTPSPGTTPAGLGGASDWAPWNWGRLLDTATGNARSTALLGLFVVLGLGLLGLGLYRAVRQRKSDGSGGG